MPVNRWPRNTLAKCQCLGYWFPHRKGGGACEFSPRADYYRALRQGVPVAEAQQLLSAADLEKLYPLEKPDE